MRILLVDDHQLFRQGLKSCLAEEPQYEVIGEADNGQEAIEKSEQLRPDLVLMDIAMPGLNGVDAARHILNRQNEKPPKLIILSSYSDQEFVTEVLRLGVAGYILKNVAFDELVNAIETVKNEQVYLSPQIAGVIVQAHVRVPPADTTDKENPARELSERECQIIRFIADGLDAKAIARHLHLSPKTVHALRNRVMSKVNVQSVAELTKYAIRTGITNLDN